MDDPTVNTDGPARMAMEAAVAASLGGAPSPDPRVGAAVLAGDTVVSTGFAAAHGAASAVETALRAAGGAARGSTVYVTLAPGSGRDDAVSAVQALVQAGVSALVYASADPGPWDTDALRALSAAGVAVSRDVHPDLCAAVDRTLRPWRTTRWLGRSHVTLKAAMTLDGRIATRTGESRWITGEAARQDGHRLRAAADAVLVGSTTVRTDDPELTARWVTPVRQPVRVVVDGHLVTACTSRLVVTARAVPTWVLTVAGGDRDRARALEDLGVSVIATEPVGGRVDLAAGLRALAARGVVAVLCEGGGGLHGALLDRGLADRVVCYIAPVLLGGNDAAPAFGGHGVGSLAAAHRLRDLEIDRVGTDLRVQAELTDDVHRDHPGGR